MSRKVIDPVWAAQMEQQLRNDKVTFTSILRVVIQHLVCRAVAMGIKYTVTNNGAGVMTFTTDVNVCPLCKREWMP